MNLEVKSFLPSIVAHIAAIGLSLYKAPRP